MKLKIPQEIQDYVTFLNSVESSSERILTKQVIEKNRKGFEHAINTFLVYPDLLTDIMTPRDSQFSLYFVQRIVLRAMARHRQSYHTFTRAFSKSFLAFLSRYINTMLVPRHFAFVVSGTKQQAAAIAKEKVTMDLWNKFPLLANEMQSTRVGGKHQQAYVQGQDYAEFRFTHGGRLDVVGTGSSSRGGRRHSGIFEEVIELQPTEINEVILPLMNKQRETSRGQINPNEPHSSKIFVTTAGYKGTFAYEKLIETICYAVLDPERYMVLGGSYHIPLMHGLLDPDQMAETLSSPSYGEDSIDREYRSIWSGTVKGAAFQNTDIVDLRKVVRAETRAAKPRDDANHFYVLAADMAKDGSANTIATIIKVFERDHSFLYSPVNFYTFDTTDYSVISLELKKIMVDFQVRQLVYDANGIGAALRDWMTKEQYDPVTGNVLPAYGIINPPERAARDMPRDIPRHMHIVFEIKASGSVNSQINRIFFSKMGSKSMRFLIPRNEALLKLEKTHKFMRMAPSEKKKALEPYILMDKLEEEMKNLEVKDVTDAANNNLVVDRRNKKIQKDFYSAVSYGVYAIHTEIEVPYYANRRKKQFKLTDYIVGA